MTATLDAMLASRTHPDELAERLTPWSAPLAQGIIVMRSNASQWLIDLQHARFQHLDTGSDPQRHRLHGTWTHYAELAFYTAEGTLVIEPETGPPLRTHIRRIWPTPPTTQHGIPPPVGSRRSATVDA